MLIPNELELPDDQYQVSLKVNMLKGVFNFVWLYEKLKNLEVLRQFCELIASK